MSYLSDEDDSIYFMENEADFDDSASETHDHNSAAVDNPAMNNAKKASAQKKVGGADRKIAEILTNDKDDMESSDEADDADEAIEDNADSDEEEVVGSSKIFSEDDDDEGNIKNIIIVSPEKRITPSIMSHYEQTECISIRATQIEKNGKCFVDTLANTPREMAEQELLMRKTPLRIRRLLGYRNINGKTYEVYEDWNPNEMKFAAPY